MIPPAEEVSKVMYMWGLNVFFTAHVNKYSWKKCMPIMLQPRGEKIIRQPVKQTWEHSSLFMALLSEANAREITINKIVSRSIKLKKCFLRSMKAIKITFLGRNLLLKKLIEKVANWTYCANCVEIYYNSNNVCYFCMKLFNL